MKRDRTILGVALLALAAAFAGDVGAAPVEAPGLKGPFRRIHVIDFEGEIEPVLATYVKRSVDAALRDKADCIVLRIYSPGGRVDSSMEIGDYLLELPADVTTIAWVKVMSFSGAAMVSLSCREIVMGPQAHLGDSQPILGDSGEIKPAGEKIETVLRARFRAYAEKNGYPTLLAEAMVSEHIEVLRVRDGRGRMYFVEGGSFREAAPEAEILPGVRRSDLTQVGEPITRGDELLTMTSLEAKDLGFLRRGFLSGAFPSSEEELITSLLAPGGTVVKVEMSFSELAIRFLYHFTGILSAVVSLALLLLLFKGPSTFTIVGGAALAMIFLITTTAGEVHGFPIFLLVVGALLLAAEIFVIPGFGLAGILGIAVLLAGFLMLSTGSTIGGAHSLEWDEARSFGLQFVATIIAGLVLILVMARVFPSVGPGRRMVLAAPAASTIAASAVAPVRAGDGGIARSTLRPAGSAEFSGHVVDVTTEGQYVEVGSRVVVVAVEGPRVVVRPAAGSEGTPA